MKAGGNARVCGLPLRRARVSKKLNVRNYLRIQYSIDLQFTGHYTLNIGTAVSKVRWLDFALWLPPSFWVLSAWSMCRPKARRSNPSQAPGPR